MSITKKFLKEFSLPPEVSHAILSAHHAAVTALVRQRDAYKQELDPLRDVQARLEDLQTDHEHVVSERDALQMQIDEMEAQRMTAIRDEEISVVLADLNANPAAVPLLREHLLYESIADVRRAAQELQRSMPGLFGQRRVTGVPVLTPPVDEAGPLTREDVAHMSEGQILQQWGVVQHALRRG